MYTSWEIVCTKDQFEQLKTEESFWAILTLARVVNVLTSCHMWTVIAGRGDTPTAKRDRSNSFLFACSVLHEGLRLADDLEKYFGSLRTFRDGLGDLMKKQATIQIRDEILKPMRNKFVFHFFKRYIRKGLLKTDFPTYVFATGSGDARSQVYYPLADEAILRFLHRKQKHEQDFESFVAQMIEKITDLMFRFGTEAEGLIAQVLGQMGWVVQERANDANI